MTLRTARTPPAADGADTELPGRVVVRLLVVLSAAADALDAVCVMRLGGAFASVVTGNLVELGLAVATGDARLAVGTTTAVGGYALGVAAGTVALGRGGGGWRRRTRLVAGAEFLLLTGAAAGWLAGDAHPGHAAAQVLLGAAAMAMGVQSTVTISSGVRGASTTYLTGTVTNLVRTLARDPRRMPLAGGDAVRVTALLGGAIVGGLVLLVAPRWALALPAVLVGAVVVAAALARARKDEKPSRNPDAVPSPPAAVVTVADQSPPFPLAGSAVGRWPRRRRSAQRPVSG
jgi:uncharacterized membrane protein YoaK (UPF0700 family)